MKREFTQTDEVLFRSFMLDNLIRYYNVKIWREAVEKLGCEFDIFWKAISNIKIMFHFGRKFIKKEDWDYLMNKYNEFSVSKGWHFAPTEIDRISKTTIQLVEKWKATHD